MTRPILDPQPPRRRCSPARWASASRVEFLGRQAFAAADGGAGQAQAGGGDLPRRHGRALRLAAGRRSPTTRACAARSPSPGFGQPGGALKLDDTFGLHPALAAVHALALKGEARIAPAVATPDRARSHFEAQDVLESGATAAYGTDSGWLNRALEAHGRRGKVKAMSVGAHGAADPARPDRGGVLVAGPAPRPRPAPARHPAATSTPTTRCSSRALASGLATEAMAKVASADATAALTRRRRHAGGAWRRSSQRAGDAMAPGRPPGGAALQPRAAPGPADAARKLGATLAGFMIQPGGPQVAAVSLDGFDTHANQGASQGQLATRLRLPRRGAGRPRQRPGAGVEGHRRSWSPPSSAAPRASTAPTAPTTAPPRPRCCWAAR